MVVTHRGSHVMPAFVRWLWGMEENVQHTIKGATITVISAAQPAKHGELPVCEARIVRGGRALMVNHVATIGHTPVELGWCRNLYPGGELFGILLLLIIYIPCSSDREPRTIAALANHPPPSASRRRRPLSSPASVHEELRGIAEKPE